METRSPDSDPPPPAGSSIRRTPKRRRITSPDAESQSTTKFPSPSLSTLCSPSVCLNLAEEARSLTTDKTWESSTGLTTLIDGIINKHFSETPFTEELSTLVHKRYIQVELRRLSLLGIVYLSNGSLVDRNNHEREIIDSIKWFFPTTKKKEDNKTAIYVHDDNNPTRTTKKLLATKEMLHNLSWDKIDVLTSVGHQIGIRGVRRVHLPLHGMIGYNTNNKHLIITIRHSAKIHRWVYDRRVADERIIHEKAEDAIASLLERHEYKQCTIESHIDGFSDLSIEHLPKLPSHFKTMTFRRIWRLTKNWNAILDSGSSGSNYLRTSLQNLETLKLEGCLARKDEINALRSLLPETNITVKEMLCD